MDLAEFFLKRLENIGPVYNALVTLTPELAKEQAQTADREFAVEDGEGRVIGTLALLDLVLAEEGGR